MSVTHQIKEKLKNKKKNQEKLLGTFISWNKLWLCVTFRYFCNWNYLQKYLWWIPTISDSDYAVKISAFLSLFFFSQWILITQI